MKQAGKGDPRVRAIAVKRPPHTLQMLFKHQPRSVGNKKQPVELEVWINAAERLQQDSTQETVTSREQESMYGLILDVIVVHQD